MCVKTSVHAWGVILVSNYMRLSNWFFSRLKRFIRVTVCLLGYWSNFAQIAPDMSGNMDLRARVRLQKRFQELCQEIRGPNGEGINPDAETWLQGGISTRSKGQATEDKMNANSPEQIRTLLFGGTGVSFASNNIRNR